MSEDTVTKKMSAAAFFNENRAIAGFGNSMRAVFTSIRELVENGLDAAEKRGINPVIDLDLRKLSSREINELLDVKQYKKLEKHLDFLQLTCKDNGIGVPGHQIAELFGRVLTGTKYGVIQTRGRFGLGAKMCLLYSMSSVDLPAKIRSRYFMDDITHELHLMINLEKNEPVIMEQHEYLPGDPNYLEEPGTEISITFTGAWRLAKNSVKEYFKQLAIITPYSSFNVKVPADKEGEYEDLDFISVVDDMPPPPQPVKIHPWGCDITQFKAELTATKSKTLKHFLSTQFMGVNEEIAEGFFQLLEIDPNKSPKDITSHEIRRIVHEGFVKAYQEAKEVKRKRDRIFQFDDPRGTALSPLGSNRLRRGLEKELEPKFVEAVTRAPKAYSGHPFVVEVAIGYGGGVNEASQVKGATVQDNKIIYRYANRIPLIFGAGNDVITHTVSSIRWNEYGLTRQSDPLAVAVSVVSTKIPFPETSKEYISIVPEIEEEIRLALMQLGRRLKTFLSRAKRRRREHARLSRFVRSAPIIIDNLTKILEDEAVNYTDFRLETDRIAAALAHGASKKVKLYMPLGRRLFGANVWCPSRIQSILRSNNIETISDFLISPSESLAKLLELTKQDIYNIKLRTISELDREGMSPDFDPKLFVSRTIERRFTQDEKPTITLKDALYRRWIQNSYHYFATDFNKLQTVTGLLEKLFENKKEELLHQYLLTKDKTSKATSEKRKQLLASLTKVEDLKIDTLFPTFEYIKDNSKGLISQDTTIEEFFYQTKLPYSVNYLTEVTAVLINYLQNIFSQLCDKFPTFSKVNVTKMTPDWTDAYTKNAFHRRKIKTIEDLVNAKLDDLVVIKELERNLYNTFLDILAKSSESIDLSKFELVSDELLKEEEVEVTKVLHQKGIKTLSHLIYLPTTSILKRDYKLLSDLLLKESKQKLISHIRESKKDKDLSHIKIIPKDIEQQLVNLQIFTTTAFLAFPSPQLRKIGLRKKDVERIKKSLGTSIFKWIKHQETLKNAGIVSIEEIFYNPPEAYNLTGEAKKAYLETANLLLTPMSFAFPSLRRQSYLLQEIGINCIGRFSIWSNSDLSDVLNISEERVKELKQSINEEEVKKNRAEFGKSLNLLSNQYPRLVQFIEKYNLTIQDLYSVYPTEKPTLNTGFWENILHLNQLANMEIIELTQLYPDKFKDLSLLTEALLRLKSRNIVTVRQFLDLIPEIIESELNTAKERKLVIDLYNNIKNRTFSETDQFSKEILLISEYDEFVQTLGLPISRISKLTLEDFDKLRNRGITAIHQLFEYTIDELAVILVKSNQEVQQIIDEFAIEKTGTHFFEKSGTKYTSLISFEYEESERFSSHEIVSLILSGYDTVDKIFYLAHPLTFSSAVVNWNVIDKFRKLLRSPLTLVTWEKIIKKTIQVEDSEETEEIEEVQTRTLTTQQLNTLRNNGITKIIDLLVSKSEDIASFLNVSIEEAILLQRNVRISDTGIDLSELGILEPRIVRVLDENNIMTIEDLYFSTSKDKWNEDILPWDVIESFKAILNLSLNHISDMLDPEIIELLEKAKIKTLLGFMLSSPEVLMEKTGIPDERFETIKSALDFSDIFGYFSLPVYFLPTLSFIQTETLRENGIKTISEFILASAQKLSKLIKISPESAEQIITSLTSSSIQAMYEQKGIFAFETQLFDKLEQRLLSRDSIFHFERFQTIQEIFYTIEEQYYFANPELWTKISAVKKYLSLPLKIFTEISEFSLEVLEQNNIHYVYQLLFIPDVDLKDTVLYRVVSTYSSKIIVMQAFHYFSKLPASVYNSSYFKKIIQDVENKTLSDVITDSKVIKDLSGKDKQYLTDNYNLTLIRSVLELPLRITPFFTKIRKARREEYKNVIIGDVFEINLEEHSALSPFYSSLMETDSLNKLIMELAIPIASMGLPRELTLKLSKSSINTLIDFFSLPEKQLSEISGFSQKQIREIKEDLTYTDIVSFRLSQAHLIRPSELIPEKKLEELKDLGITDIETLFFSAPLLGVSKILLPEEYKKAKELLSGSIRFIGFFSYDEIKRLEYHEINSVIDLTLINKEELFTITQNPIYKEFHALDLISFDELSERRISSAIPLSVCPSIEEDYLEKLLDIGINSVQDFISRMEEMRESHPALVRLDIFREIQLYRASVAFIGLENHHVMKLIYSGVGDILSFITEDVSTISLLLKISEKKVQTYLDEITPSNLTKEVERKGVKLDDFSVLSKGKINSLLRSGKEYVQDLYSSNYQAYPTLSVSGDYMRDFLSACHFSVYRIKELSSEEKMNLIGEGILRLIDLFNCSDKDLKRAFSGRISKTINSIRKGNFTLSKGTTLTLNEPIVNLLKSLEFDPTKKAVEDIFGFIPDALLQLSESDRIVKTSSIAFIEQLVSYLCLNILALPSFDITTKAVLWNNGIKHVIELLSTDVRSIIGIPQEVAKHIRTFQREFNLSSRMSETFSHYIDHALSFPNKAEKQFMKYGLSSAQLLIDFIPHPVFNFGDIEKSLIRIISSNMFKPVSWLTSNVDFSIRQLNILSQNDCNNIISGLLCLSKREESHDLHSRIVEVLNKTIIQVAPPEWALKLSDVKIVLEPKLVKKLKDEKIIYLDELLALDSKIIEKRDLLADVCPILLSLKSIPLSYLGSLTAKQLDKLNNNGIRNLYQFLLIPTPLLAKLINISEDKINSIRKTIDIKSLEENVKLMGLDIALFPEISKETKNVLSEYGCVSLVQASELNLDLIPISIDEKKNLVKLISILLTPITLIGKSLKLKDTEIKELLNSKITIYNDLLAIPQKNWPTSINKLISKQKEEPDYLVKNLKKIDKFGISIESLGLTKKISTSLLQIGISTIEHLFFVPVEYIITNSKIKGTEVEGYRNQLSNNISYLSSITKESLDYCYEKGFTTIIEHLIFIDKLPKNIQDEIILSLSLIKNIKEERFTEPLSELEVDLSSKGYSSYKTILTSPTFKDDETVFNKVAPYLFANLRFLDFDSKDLEKMKSAGVNIIADIFYLSPKVIASNSKVKVTTIQNAVKNFKVDVIAQRIDSIAEQNLKELFFLSAQERNYLKSIGMYNLEDLMNNTIYDWLISEKKIKQIQNKAEEVYCTSVLYYPKVNQKNLTEIKTDFLDIGIITFRDLMSVSDPAERSSIVNYLNDYVASKEGIIANHISKDQYIEESNVNDLFTKKIKTSDIKSILDLITAIYQNEDNLTDLGYQIKQTFSKPISSLAVLTKADLQILEDRRIFTIGDFIIKPISSWMILSPAKLKEKILEITSSLSYKKIETDVKKKVQLNKVKIFDAETKKEIQKHYSTMDDLIYALNKETFTFSKSLANKIKRILELPIELLLLPDVTIKSWKNIQSYVKNLEEFYLITNKELASVLSLKQVEVDKIRYSLTTNNFGNHPVIKESKIFSKKDIVILNQRNIKYYSDLFNKKVILDKIPNHLKDKIRLFEKIGLKDFDPNAEFSLNMLDLAYLSMNLNKIVVTKKQRDDIQNVINFIFNKGNSLMQVLELEAKDQKLEMSDTTIEYLLLLRKHDPELYNKTISKLHSKINKKYNEFSKYLERSIILLLPNRLKVDIISKLPYKDISELLLEDYNKIKNQINDAVFLRNLRNISLSSLIAAERNLTGVPKDLLSGSNISILQKASILSIEEALVFNKQSKTKTSSVWKTSDSLKNIVETDLFALPPIREDKRIYELITKLKLQTVFDFMVYCKSLNETEYETVCASLLPKLSSTRVERMVLLEQKRLSSFVKDKEILSFLRKEGIRTIGILLEYIETKDPNDYEPEIVNLIEKLRAPMFLFIEQLRLLNKFQNAGINQVVDFISIPDIRKAIGVSLTEQEQTTIKNLQDKMNSQLVSDALKGKSYNVKKVGLFDTNLRKLLTKSGYTTIAHLNVPEDLIVNTSKLNSLQVSRIKKNLDLPFYYLNDIIVDNPQSAVELYKNNVHTLWDIFAQTAQKLSRMTGIQVSQLRTHFSNFTQDTIKNAEKEIVLIRKTHPFLNEEIIGQLQKAGIKTLQQIIFPDPRIMKNTLLNEQSVKNLRVFLDKPINNLELELEVEKQIKALGINTVKEFIIFPATMMDEKTNLSYLSIKNLKNRLPAAKSKPTKKIPAKASTKTPSKSTTTTKSPVATNPKTSTKPKVTSKQTVTKPKTTKGKQTTLFDVSQKNMKNDTSKKTSQNKRKEVK